MTYNKVEYNANYTKTKYDTFNVRVPKGNKEEIEAYYKEAGYSSMNNYVTTLIQNDMDIAHKELEKLDTDEKYLVNCYRYASEEDKAAIRNLASKIESKLSQLEKQKLFNLRKHVTEKQVDEEWQETFGKEKLPPFHMD